MNHVRQQQGFPHQRLLRSAGTWVLLLLFSFPVLSLAQEAGKPKQFDRPYWEKTIEGLDYRAAPGASPSNTQIQQPQPKEEEDRKAAEQREQNWDFSIPGFRLIGKILLILGAALILFLLLRALLGVQWAPRNKRMPPAGDPEADLEKIEEDIESFNLDDYICKALEQDAFPLAIRLLYLAVLKELSTAKRIRWKKDKTNRDYLREMQETPLTGEFIRLTRAFEQIWYGDPPFTEADYRDLEPHFRRFIRTVQSSETAVSNNL